MSKVGPELAEALKKRPFPKLPERPSHREARAAHLRTLRHLMPVPGPIPDEVAEEELTIPARDGYNVPVISYKPVKQSTPGPLIVLFHEGGWATGDRTDEEFNARLLTRELGASCLNVEYRLAPEHKFPTGINDCWDVLQWAAKNASSLNADPSKGFIVGGSSAGGNISAVLAHKSRNENLQPPVTGQWLSVAYLLPGNRVPDKYKADFISMKESSNDPILPPMDDTAPDGVIMQSLRPDLDSPLFSVISPELYPPTPENQAGKGPLARAFFQVGGIDVLRDHSLVYERILREDFKTETKLIIYPGFGHMFWTNWPEMETSKKFAQDTLSGMKWLLDIYPTKG